MTNLAKYEAVFRDKFGTNEIVLHTDFKEFSFELRGVQFRGSSLDDFELKDLQNYSQEKLKQFFLNKFNRKEDISYELCGYELQFSIPTLIFDVQKSTYLQNQIHLKITTGNPASHGGIDFVEIKLSIKIQDEVFEAKSDFFEPAALQIQKQLKGRYKFRNCFGCNYSDYSVYGQALFGGMLCFANQKTTYLKVKNKAMYMDLTSEKMLVQETFSCEEFEFRGGDVGYRD